MPLDDFRSVRIARLLHHTLQVVLAITLVSVINYIAAVDYHRYDLTREAKYSLAPETLAYVRQLEAPIEVILTTPGEDATESEAFVYADLDKLLQEFAYQSRREGRDLITIERVNVYRQRDRAQALVRDYGIDTAKRNVLLVVSGEKSTEIDGSLLYNVDEAGNNEFTGERALTSAILEVSSQRKPIVYYVVGHGEKRPDKFDALDGLSKSADYLRQRNWDVRTLDFAVEDAVPADADLVILASPRVPLLPVEVDELHEYLSQRNGRLLMTLDPGFRHGLDDLLFNWGLRSDDMIVIEDDPNSLVPGGDILIYRYGEHPVTEAMHRYGLRVLVGLCRPIRQDLGAPIDETLNLGIIMGTSEISWGERAYRIAQTPQFDAATDMQGPVTIAMTADRSGTSDVGIRLPGGRLAVFGTSGFLTNNRFDQLGNNQLFHSTVNWMMEKDQALLNIKPRQWKPVEITLSTDQASDLRLRMLYLPGVVAALGLIIAVIRRT